MLLIDMLKAVLPVRCRHGTASIQLLREYYRVPQAIHMFLDIH